MRNSATGSFARTGLPQPIPSATYDAANELLAWNESAPSYDANGNMLSDGVHNYAWDARNHLSTIDSGSTGSFVYDPAGRRATKVISGTATNFLYDLANPVQELSGTTPTANLLTGGLDQYLTRTDSSGTANFLTDALGSTLALSDATGTVQTQYNFDPFGSTVQSGNTSANSFAYTGRESDGTGLYYYRARYYNPQLGRFVSEDPLGFGGGVNSYAYAGGNPSNFGDPSGLDYTVTQSGDTIVVSANIGVYGEGASQAQAWQNTINDFWNNFGSGWQYKGCKVKFNARLTASPKARSYLDFTTNWDGLVNAIGPSGEDFRDGTVLGYYGVWAADASGGTIAHEFGHILGLPDYYRDYWHGIRVPNAWGLGTSVSLPGYENDIMADDTVGFVTQADVDQVLAGRACGCKK
jgi:RHS repeat-associated protein